MKQTYILLVSVAILIVNPLLAKDKNPMPAVNKFGFEYLKNNIDNSGNWIFSPMALLETSGMVYEAAGGDTKKLLKEIIGIDDKTYPLISSSLSVLKKVDNMNMNIYNSIWLQKSFKPNSKLTKALNKKYAFTIRTKDFITYKEKSIEQINRYIEDANKKKIKNTLNPGDVDGRTRFLALSGITYYHSLVERFGYNVKNSFNGKPDLQFVSLVSDKFFYETENYRAVHMNYEKNRYSIIFIDPKDGNSVQSLAKDILNETEYNKILNGFATKTVKLLVPKFAVDTAYNSNHIYTNLGVGNIFNDKADFSTMCNEKVKLDQFIQKVKFSFTGDVKGKGVKLGLDKETLSPKTIEFTLSKSFIFVVKENKTNGIILMGTIQNL